MSRWRDWFQPWKHARSYAMLSFHTLQQQLTLFWAVLENASIWKLLRFPFSGFIVLAFQAKACAHYSPSPSHFENYVSLITCALIWKLLSLLIQSLGLSIAPFLNLDDKPIKSIKGSAWPFYTMHKFLLYFRLLHFAQYLAFSLASKINHSQVGRYLSQSVGPVICLISRYGCRNYGHTSQRTITGGLSCFS